MEKNRVSRNKATTLWSISLQQSMKEYPIGKLWLRYIFVKSIKRIGKYILQFLSVNFRIISRSPVGYNLFEQWIAENWFWHLQQTPVGALKWTLKCWAPTWSPGLFQLSLLWFYFFFHETFRLMDWKMNPLEFNFFLPVIYVSFKVHWN